MFSVELVHRTSDIVILIQTFLSACQFEVDGKAIALLSRGKCLRLLWIRCGGCVVCAVLFPSPAKKWCRRRRFHGIIRKRAIATKRWRGEIRIAHRLFDIFYRWNRQSIDYRRKPRSVGKFDSQTKLDGLLLGTVHDGLVYLLILLLVLVFVAMFVILYRSPTCLGIWTHVRQKLHRTCHIYYFFI